jgi:hypothetical protein
MAAVLSSGGAVLLGDVPAEAAARRDGRPAWAALAGAETRMAALGRDLAASIARRGVPVPAIEAVDIGSATGLFDARAWTLRISRAALMAVPVAPSSLEARALAAAAHHEARHAEQWFAMARLRAGDGRSATQIGVEMGLPAKVAAAAVKAGPVPARQRAEAQAWWDSVYGPGAGRRNQVLSRLLEARAAYDTAARTYRTAPSPAAGTAMLDAHRHLDGAFADYRDLPEEADALAHQASHERSLARAAR